jgi:Vitamin K-dependent gamma-carboxylase
LCFTVGFCTRVTSVLAWLAAISYIQRSPTSIFGMDTMMNILLIYLMIGPSGAALSVDRLLSRLWVTYRARRDHLPVPAWTPPVPRVSANVALRLVQIHLCIIYMTSGLSKLQGNVWWNGTAVWATMAIYEYCPMQIGAYGALLKFLCAHRWLWETFMTGGVAFTLFTEIGFPFLAWNRKLRWFMITMAVFLHTGIAMVMGLRTFSLLMLTMLCAFVPQETVDRWRSQVAEWISHLGFARKRIEAAPSDALVRPPSSRTAIKVSDRA